MSHERIEVIGDGGNWIAERLQSFRLTSLGQSESLSIVRKFLQSRLLLTSRYYPSATHK